MTDDDRAATSVDSYPHQPYPNFCLLVLAAIFVLLVLLAVIGSPSPLAALLLICIGILPTFIAFSVLHRALRDEAVPPSFLYDQFLLGAFPLSLLAMVVESVIVVIILLVIFQDDLSKFKAIILNASSNDPLKFSPEDLISFIKAAPVWKLILTSVGLAFLAAAATEEAAKWLLALRYRAVDDLPHNVHRRLNISPRGMLAVAAAGALGFATMENLLSVMKTAASLTTSTSAITSGLIGTLIRDMLAIPLHVCTTTFVMINVAQRRLYHDGHSVMAALFVAVFVHGLFDAVPIAVTVLVVRESIPQWSAIVVQVGQFALMLVFLLLFRARYKALIARERAVTVPSEQAHTQAAQTTEESV